MGLEGGCTGGREGVEFLGSDASAGEFYLADNRSSAGRKNNYKHGFPLVVNLRVGASEWFICPEIGERMLDKLIISHKTLQRYLTDLSRHCQSSMGLVKAEHKNCTSYLINSSLYLG